VKLKLDENLGHIAAEVFRAAGHDIETVRDEGLSGAADVDVIAAGRLEGRCLVTLDLEFGNPLVFKPAEFAGIAVLRLPAKPTQNDLFLACRTLVAAFAQGDIVGKLWSVHRGFIREYRPDKTADDE
jgi:predicted nuclease of predicted toxin-antitoxin system